MTDNNNIQLMINHRSVRKFKNRPISDELLEEMVMCGMRASNTGNMQLYSVIATREEPLRSQLASLHFNQCATAPLLLTICVDINRYHGYCRVNGCDQPYSNTLWFLSATVDASLAAQNIALAAEARGLGLCFLGTVMYNTEQIATLLQCPKGVVPVITMAMGYPDEDARYSERLDTEAILHHEHYHDYTDEDIVRIHRVRDEHPFNQEMVKQNKTRNYCEIFTTIRYPRSQNEQTSEALSQFIDKHFIDNH